METNVRTTYDLSLFEKVPSCRRFRAPDILYFGVSEKIRITLPEIIAAKLKTDEVLVDIYLSRNGETVIVKISEAGTIKILKNKKADRYIMYCSNVRRVLDAKNITRPARYKLEWIAGEQMWAGKLIK